MGGILEGSAKRNKNSSKEEEEGRKRKGERKDNMGW